MAATLLGGCAPLKPAPSSRRRLKDIVSGPTVDVEVHLSDVELWTGTEIPDRIPPEPDALARGMKRMRWDKTDPLYASNLERFREYRSRTSIDLRTEFLLNEFDEAGLDIAVHMAVDHTVKSSNIGRHHAAGFDRLLADAKRIREQHPQRIISFVGIDPRSGAADATSRFRTAIEDYGFRGLGEIVLQQFELYPHDRSLYPLYEQCVEYGVPFVGNCEGPAPYTMPGEFAQVARDFPELRICLAGAGRPRDPSHSKAPIAEAIRMANEYENIYLDTADWERRDEAGIRLFLSFLRQCMNGDARTKVMYASDFPVFTAMYHPAEWIDVVINRAGDYDHAFSDAEIERFFSTNALSFLGGAP